LFFRCVAAVFSCMFNFYEPSFFSGRLLLYSLSLNSNEVRTYVRFYNMRALSLLYLASLSLEDWLTSLTKERGLCFDRGVVFFVCRESKHLRSQTFGLLFIATVLTCRPGTQRCQPRAVTPWPED